MQHAWMLLNFFPFPVGHPPHPPCRYTWLRTEAVGFHAFRECSSFTASMSKLRDVVVVFLPPLRAIKVKLERLMKKLP